MGASGERAGFEFGGQVRLRRQYRGANASSARVDGSGTTERLERRSRNRVGNSNSRWNEDA
jgi:hypothetical protein